VHQIGNEKIAYGVYPSGPLLLYIDKFMSDRAKPNITISLAYAKEKNIFILHKNSPDI
jgi:hypothetical protein